MTNDDRQKHLASPAADDAALAREIEADPTLRDALGRAAGLEDFDTHLRPLAQEAGPLPSLAGRLGGGHRRPLPRHIRSMSPARRTRASPHSPKHSPARATATLS